MEGFDVSLVASNVVDFMLSVVGTDLQSSADHYLLVAFRTNHRHSASKFTVVHEIRNFNQNDRLVAPVVGVDAEMKVLDLSVNVLCE